ncbi:MAG: hypothetical protein FGM33_04275, partial [Candidatus Kapabacteria bacterium]|nr:hypothetical protein [Candidatus Kapabacteria bacterium]
MAMFRTLFMLCGIMAAAMSLSAQTTWYVRANGAAGNTGLAANNAFRQIENITALADGDVIDIGAGDFAGANIAVSVTISGSNAGFAGFTQPATNLGQITLTGNDKTLTIEGVRWSGGVVPVSVTGTEAIVTISNSKFDEAGAITATAANWNELLISSSTFDGDIAGGVAPIANAIVATGLDILSVSENTFSDYTQTAVITNGANSSVTIKNNDFIGNNSSGGTNQAAVSYEGSSATGAVADILYNRFDGNKNGLVTSGTLTSLMVARYNMFSNTGAGFYAIKRLTGSGTLTASCNAYGSNAAASTVRGLLDGTISALPYNYAGTDQFPATVGFEPVVAEQCAADGPVRSSTTEGAGTSYFTISEAISASASGATVRIGRDVYNENLSITKRLYLFAYSDQPAWANKTIDTAADGRTRANWVDVTGTVTITSVADTVLIKGLKFRRPATSGSTNVNLLTSNASKYTLIRNCYFDVSSGTTLTSIPSNGVIHSVRAGDLIVEQCHVTRPGSDKFARAVTFASGNGCREVNIVNNNLYGTVQVSGLSALSNVYIRNNYIENAGIDGIAVTGNYARTLNILFNTIDQSQENGIAFRNGASIGSNLANIQNNLITNSGKLNGSSSFAAINIGSLTTGDNHLYTNNLLGAQHGSALAFINGRSTFIANASCNWWTNISEDVIVTRLGGVGTINYDNGTDGWLSSSGNSRTGSGINGFEATGTCSVRSFTITLNTTNISCNNANNGSIASSISPGTVQSYLWSNSATTSSISGLSANTYSVTITSTTGNIRSKTDDVYNPTAITADVSKTNITCFTATDGTITVSNAAGGTHADIAGGSRTFHYSLKQSGTGTVVRAPSSTSAFTGLDVGVYEVFVTALATTNGTSVNPACETKIGTTYEVTRPAAVTSNITGTATICTAGSTNLSISFNGVAPYTFKINDGASQNAPSSPHTVTVTPGATTTYTVTSVTDANGCSALEADRTGSATVTINMVSAGVIAGSQTICAGDNAAAFTEPTVASGTGILSYQWQTNTDLTTANWTNVSGATSATYDEGTLSNDVQYRRIVTSSLNSVQCSAVSNVVTVTVNNVEPGIHALAIEGSQTICSGSDPVAFTSTGGAVGDGDITYQWQLNTNIGSPSWSNINAATGLTYDAPVLTDDAQYRRVATSALNSVSCSVASNVLTVTVNNLSEGAISGNQTICEQADPVAFTSTTAASGDGPITYQWQLNTNIGTPSWGNIDGATLATYDAGTLTADAQYRRIATSTLNSLACSAVSNTLTVTVNNLNAGSITGEQTICNGATPATIGNGTSATGDGTITFRWQYSPSAMDHDWANVLNESAATYSPAAMYASMYFRRGATSTLSGVPCTKYTDPIRITVQSVPTAGVIAGAQTICNGGNPAAFTSTTNGDGSGTITYRWESSTNGTTWTSISGESASTYDVPAGLTTTTQYRRTTISTLNSVACESVPTASITVTVQSVPTAGVIAAAQTICNGGNPAAFTSTTDGTGSGTITYRWESSTDGTNWAAISGESASTYDVPADLTTTTHYRRTTISTLNSVACESVPTASITVTVQSVPTAGVIAGAQTICNGGNPAAFTSTTDGTGSGTTIAYRWESSTDGTNWAAISGATGATYDAPSGLTTTTHYRRTTISTQNGVACESVPTASITVTVQSVPTAGAIAGAQTICNGGNPAAFSSTTDGTGSGTITYRWESSINGTTWTPISGESASTYDVPEGLTTTTHYRRTTISTQNSVACESVPTASITVTVQSVPTAGVIAAAQTICNGGDPAAFTSTTAGTGDGDITYRWESSTNGTTWSTIGGATSATYDVSSGLTTTTQYRRVTISTLNSVACESVPTASITVTVQSVPTAGVIAAAQTICNGGDPAAFTSTTDGAGSGTITYRWESSTNGTDWTPIASQTASTYDVPAGLLTTTHYRRTTISTQNSVACESVPTASVIVTVRPQFTAGAIATTGQTICYAGTASEIGSQTASSGGDGTITYSWRSSADNYEAAIGGATSATYTPPAGLTTTTSYR